MLRPILDIYEISPFNNSPAINGLYQDALPLAIDNPDEPVGFTFNTPAAFDEGNSMSVIYLGVPREEMDSYKPTAPLEVSFGHNTLNGAQHPVITVQRGDGESLQVIDKTVRKPGVRAREEPLVLGSGALVGITLIGDLATPNRWNTFANISSPETFVGSKDTDHVSPKVLRAFIGKITSIAYIAHKLERTPGPGRRPTIANLDIIGPEIELELP